MITCVVPCKLFLGLPFKFQGPYLKLWSSVIIKQFLNLSMYRNTRRNSEVKTFLSWKLKRQIRGHMYERAGQSRDKSEESPKN